MTELEAPATRHAGAGAPPAVDREKEFFTTWLRLMERLKDAQDLTQALQSVLSAADGADAKLQDARHQTKLLSANDKTLSELVALLNDFFFRDIAPALKRAKRAGQQVQQQQQQVQDPLDQYLEHGEEGAAMPQTFVDDMSGWAALDAPQSEENTPAPTSTQVESRADDVASDDEIPSDRFHDLLIANNLKVTAMQARDYSAMVPQRVAQQPAPPLPADPQRNGVDARTNASPLAAMARKSGRGSKMGKRGRVAPPPIVTDLPPRSASARSTPRTQSRSPEGAMKKDRIGKRAAADLVAKQVLKTRIYGSAREYLVRWKGVAQPLWISRRKAPQQAKPLIDQFGAQLRTREAELARRAAADQTQARSGNAKRKAARTGTSLRQQTSGTPVASKAPEAEFYTVDHIVNHRTHYNKRQYLVRWENYDASDDTWENGDKLRVDVPDIVDAYEAQLEHDQTHAEALQSAISELNRDTAVRSKSTSKKRGLAGVSVEDAAKDKTQSLDQGDDDQANEKRRRIATEKEVQGNGGVARVSNQFDLEEAELEEFSEDEFADILKTRRRV
ncbi:Heterochromatin-associated protein HP-1 [Phytophthora cinnamomi]|uniref:Heterochromatin-associated protein HP-1 n=1 Tax=Phytophthora cinnamomi TaxID=4785 RepID=UPI0035597207|nr:Heterochromatin-associated protein HP-1 [Phytophthora cinnamomi]